MPTVEVRSMLLGDSYPHDSVPPALRAGEGGLQLHDNVVYAHMDIKECTSPDITMATHVYIHCTGGGKLVTITTLWFSTH